MKKGQRRKENKSKNKPKRTAAEQRRHRPNPLAKLDDKERVILNMALGAALFAHFDAIGILLGKIEKKSK